MVVVAPAFVVVADREIVVFVVSLWSVATVGSTVPLSASILIVPPEPSAPLALVVIENEYRTCCAPPACVDSVTALTF
jgi:hypothetical protein